MAPFSISASASEISAYASAEGATTNDVLKKLAACFHFDKDDVMFDTTSCYVFKYYIK